MPCQGVIQRSRAYPKHWRFICTCGFYAGGEQVSVERMAAEHAVLSGAGWEEFRVVTEEKANAPSQ